MLQQSFDKYPGSPRAWSPDAAAADFSGYGASLAGGKGFQNVLVGNQEMQLNFPTGVLGYQTHHIPFYFLGDENVMMSISLQSSKRRDMHETYYPKDLYSGV
jgi:hypothetical protein